MNENTGTPISSTTRPDAENVVEPSKTIDLASIMFSQQKAKEEPKAEPVEEKQEPELSPLEKLRKSQEEHGLGMEITQGSFEEKTPTKEFRNPIDSDVRRENAEKAIAESDEKLTKRSAVVLIRQPGKNADSDAKASAEYAEAEIELDSLEFDANGKPYFNYFQEDAEGNKTPLTPKYFIIRTPEYGPYDPKTEKLYAEGKTPKEVQAILKADGTPTDTKEQPSGFEGSVESTSASVSTDGDETEEDARKKKIVQVLIDKTGYGTAPIEFTDEEKKVIRLDIFEKGKMSVIRVTNYIANKPKMADGIPVTTKRDNENHGFGIKSIRNIAEEYGGMMYISTDNHTFGLVVVIPTSAASVDAAS